MNVTRTATDAQVMIAMPMKEIITERRNCNELVILAQPFTASLLLQPECESQLRLNPLSSITYKSECLCEWNRGFKHICPMIHPSVSCSTLWREKYSRCLDGNPLLFFGYLLHLFKRSATPNDDVGLTLRSNGVVWKTNVHGCMSSTYIWQ